MKKWLQFLAVSLIYLNASAQADQKILLKNHSITIDNSLEEGLKPLVSEQGQSFIYRIVQFTTVENIKLDDATADYEVLEYIPKKAYLMKITTSKSMVEFFRSNGASTATVLAPEWKLSKKLYQENIPEWAFTKDNNVRIWLKYYHGLDHAQVTNQIRSTYTVSRENALENLVEVVVDPSKIKELASLPFIYYVQEMEDPGQPENYTGRTSHRVNATQSSFAGAPSYDGAGVVVGHGDDGRIGPHIDYTGRFSQPTATASTGDHGDHVAGIIFGAGNLDPTGRGNAPGAEIYYQTYPDNLNDVDQNYSNLNVRVTVSSYSNGCNAGYTNFTRRMDQDAIDNPNLIHVFSAGNNGTSNCGYGAGNTWGNVTGGHKIAKNVIAVANLNASDVLTTSSSRGPASDGRIKPDVSAVGTSVYSTTNPNLYTFKTGTSMSCPGVGGVLAVLYEAYRDHNQGNDPKTGLIKAILMNTCDDLGNPGPDFRFGYGRVNTRRAYEVIEAGGHITDNITNGASKSFQITVPPNTAEARVMVYWPDAPASTIAAYALVNDIDMEVSQNGTTYQPWVLDPTPNAATLNNNAVRSIDTLNNVEQVTIANPGSGDITVTVDGTNIPGSAQEFYIVYEFVKDEVVLAYPLGGEGFVPGETEQIRWDAPEGNSNFTLEYSDDAGTSWNVISASINANTRFFNWTVPNVVDGDYKLRITRGGSSSETPGTFTVVNTPSNIHVSSSCPDSLTLTWNPVNGATGYVVYRLGTMYMDSIASTQTTFVKVPQNIAQTEWYSVAALTNGNGLGRRAFAIEKVPTGVFNCPLDDDLNVAQILSPPTGYMPSCFNVSNAPVTVRLINDGLNDAYNFDVSYQLDNGTIVTQTVTDTIPIGGTMDYTFTGSTLNLSTSTSYDLSVWATYSMDDNGSNDSIGEVIFYYPSQSVAFPYSHDFENFSLCGTNNDCGSTTCALANGWENPANFTYDDIDWRTNDGPTASNGTGPSADHTLGTSAGKYLYLEASAGCDSSLAMLQSPCIDLSTATSPLLDFWYHMNGGDMGILSVDIFDGSEWTRDAFKIAGNQGNNWHQATVNLLPYVGKTIIVRINGKTGSGFQSDLAIDDINLSENTAAPSSAFNVSNAVTCIDGVVDFTDVSTNVPTSWEWQISPSTFTYVNGTDSSFQNISVQFHAVGTYSVSLITTNGNGSDTLTQTTAVTVDPGRAIPIFEDFEGNQFAPADWTIENPDGMSQWQVRSVVGASGNASRAATFDNFNTSSIDENDGLVTMNLDLRTAVTPSIFFDVAYAPKSLSSGDSLILDVSFDCGQTYTRTVYQKDAGALATAGTSSSLFTPSAASHWRRDTLDLSPYIGNNVKVRFRNYSRGGNAVYIDNIQIVNSSVVAPIALFTTPDSLICNNDMIPFTDASTGGTADTYQWDFTLNAIPSSANTAGPHSVRFVNNGMHTVTLTVTNQGGISQYTYNVYVEETPLAVFTETYQTVQDVQFNDLSPNSPTDWQWDFGDGNTSTVQNPLHTYAADGTYNVELIASNRCGSSTRTRIITIQGIGIDEELVGLSNLGLFPNPSKDVFTLSFSSNIAEAMEVDIMDLSGKVINQIKHEATIGQNDITFDLGALAEGIYLVKVRTEKGSKTLRAVKQ